MNIISYINYDNTPINKYKFNNIIDIIKILKYIIPLKKYKTIRTILSLNKNICNDNIDNISDFIIEYNDEKIICLYQKECNIDWNIITKKLINAKKYNEIIRLIINNKLVINYKTMDNELFKKYIIGDTEINIELLEILITEELSDKIDIYCEYGIITNLLIEILLEKYNKYNLTSFLLCIDNVSDKMLEIIIRTKKYNYLKLLEEVLNQTNINSILEYSLIYNYQDGIDMSITKNANYIFILNKIMKII